MRAFLGRLGRRAARWHWAVIVAWLVVVGGLVLARAAFGGNFADDYGVPGSQSRQGGDLLTTEFPQQSGYAGQIVFGAPAGSTVTAHAAPVNASIANVAKLDHVLAAVSPYATPDSPLVSKDGTVAYGTVNFDVPPGGLGTGYLHELDAAVAPARSAGLEVEYGGGAGQIGQRPSDIGSEGVGLACALLLLLFMFGSLVAATIPLLSAVFSVGAGLSLLGLLAAAFTFPTTSPTIATLLGLGVAIDYGLFQVARHREHLDLGEGPVEAAGAADATSGAAIVVAGSTVVIAILGLFVAGVPFISALGVSAAVVVAVTMLAALTLVPAFLGTAGRTVRSLRERRRGRTGPVETDPRLRHTGFARWGATIARHPWIWGLSCLVVLLLLALPLLWIQFGQLDAGTDPTSRSDRRAYDLITKGFGVGANGPLTVVVTIPAGQTQQQTQTLLTDTQATLAKAPDVASVTPATLNAARTTAVLNVIPQTDPQSRQTTDLVGTLRDSTLKSVPATTYVTGTVAGYVDFTDRVVSRLPWLIGIVVLLSLLLLTTAFRSLAIGLKAAAMNLLSVAAAYGVVVAVFQWGWGSSLIGVPQTVPIPAFVPMLMFAIVFGLSMDYEVFLLSRVHEAYLRDGDAHGSVVSGIASTARVITTAAAVMIAVFLSFVADPNATVKMLAVGMAASVLIDASLVRMILVPAVMSVLGDRAWWIPRWLDRILPHLHLEETEPASRPVTTAAG